MYELIKNLKKGELHVHLNGLVSTEVIFSLLNNQIPNLKINNVQQSSLNVLEPAKSLADYLKPWELLRLVPKSRSDLTLIIINAFENLKKSNVSFVELRNSVIYIASLNNVSVDVAMAWLIQDIEMASELYNIKGALILTVSRGDLALEQMNILIDAYLKLGKPPLVVGLDLAGNEELQSPQGLAHEFVKAKSEFNFGITVHAGETGNFKNIEIAVRDFKADRIGHGTAAIKSDSTMEMLREKNICIEVCPISNRLTNAVPQQESHPVTHFIKNDLPFVICSDNPSIHCSSIDHDYLEFYHETDSLEHINEMLKIQKRYSFIEGL
ncbi:adenosine deaminase [Pseudoalteromonas spongiae]|uniref:adenosine deaminase n=1 Tax=Pseudoalteromonas spongiae TaxID=298657 RepID=UPI000C2D52FD|nr:adenosine deaminase [Pseudoalteromonas spongiae]